MAFEKLFGLIRLYIEDSCGKIKFEDHETLVAPRGADDALNNFDSYCFTATMLLAKGLPVEFRHSLSKACALVDPILRYKHPRTLAYFLEVFIHLMQSGLPDISFYLCTYIKRVSEYVTTENDPLGQICRLLCKLESRSFDQAMAQIWKCITDILDRKLGRSHRFAVSVRLDYIKRVVTSLPDEERLLRELLAQFGSIPSHPTP